VQTSQRFFNFSFLISHSSLSLLAYNFKSYLWDGSQRDAVRRLIPNSPEKWSFFNDFLPVFEAAAETEAGGSAGAVYREIISGLKAAGAGFAGLSGSGSACFGVFTSPVKAAGAKEVFKKHGFCIYETFPLAYWSIQYYN